MPFDAWKVSRELLHSLKMLWIFRQWCRGSKAMPAFRECRALVRRDFHQCTLPAKWRLNGPTEVEHRFCCDQGGRICKAAGLTTWKCIGLQNNIRNNKLSVPPSTALNGMAHASQRIKPHKLNFCLHRKRILRGYYLLQVGLTMRQATPQGA